MNHTPNMQLEDFVDDESQDLSALDRGDDVAAAKPDATKAADKPDAEPEAPERARGPDGKFIKGDKAAEEEEEADEEGEEGEEGERDTQNLPIRLNKMREQRDRERERAEALSRELEQLRTGAKPDKPEPEVDPVEAIGAELDALYERVEEARLDGDAKTAAKLQREIDEKNRSITELKAERLVADKTSAVTENQKYDAMLDSLEAAVPQLRPDSDDFDVNAVKGLEFHVSAYEKMGMSATKALHMAANMLFGAQLRAAAETAGRGGQKAPEPIKPADKKVDVKKNVEAAKRQPPDVAARGVSKDDAHIDPRELSDEEFDKLPESTKAKLRGDNA